MKTQISKPARERRSYTQEYKQEALSLWRASGRSAAKVAAELGIRPPWSSLKYELVCHQRFATRAEARNAIFDYIETFYNRTRLHSSLAYTSPITFLN